VQTFGRQDDHYRLFQPARQGPQNYGRARTVRAGLAGRRERSDGHDRQLPAGKYTLFTVPGEDKWSLVISKKTGEWGTAYPGPDNDLARIDMKVSKTSAPVENFTIAFDEKGGACTLRMEWENTRASVNVK
jgi:Protein of unknown function (DUF2911)